MQRRLERYAFAFRPSVTRMDGVAPPVTWSPFALTDRRMPLKSRLACCERGGGEFVPILFPYSLPIAFNSWLGSVSSNGRVVWWKPLWFSFYAQRFLLLKHVYLRVFSMPLLWCLLSFLFFRSEKSNFVLFIFQSLNVPFPFCQLKRCTVDGTMMYRRFHETDKTPQ